MAEETILQRKVAKQIQIEVSDILLKEQKIPLGAMLTISVVRVSKDLELAKLYVSIFPESMQEDVLAYLGKNAWEIRKLLSKRIRNQFRKMPQLAFFLDDTPQEVERISNLISTLEIPDENKDYKIEEEEE